MAIKRIIMGAALVLFGLLVFFLQSRVSAETQTVNSFLEALSDSDFDAAFLMLSKDGQAFFGNSDAFRSDYLSRYPIPNEWDISTIPDNNDDGFYAGKLTDQNGKEFRWRIEPRRDLGRNEPVYINRYRFFAIE